MENEIKQFQKWLEEVDDFSLPKFKELPNIDLYMEQVLKYINDVLDVFSSEDQKMLTSFMVLCGTNGPSNAKLKMGYLLAKMIVNKKNWNKPGKFLTGMGLGPYTKAIKNRKTDLDWLSYNEDNVDAYIIDPFCGHMNTQGFWKEFLKGMALALVSCGKTVTLNYYLHYRVSDGGSLTGDVVQVVLDGKDGTLVTATPSNGYYFVSWSDGLKTTDRIDTRVHVSGASHLGSDLSCADVLAVLYSSVMKIDPKNPLDPHRDYFLMGKGHASAALYSCLANRGFFAHERLKSFYQDGSVLSGHVTKHNNPGIELSTGSLGHAPKERRVSLD